MTSLHYFKSNHLISQIWSSTAFGHSTMLGGTAGTWRDCRSRRAPCVGRQPAPPDDARCQGAQVRVLLAQAYPASGVSVCFRHGLDTATALGRSAIMERDKMLAYKCVVLLICFVCGGRERPARQGLNAFQSTPHAGSPRCTKKACNSSRIIGHTQESYIVT